MINVATIFSEILVFRRYQILKTTNLKRILLVFMKKKGNVVSNCLLVLFSWRVILTVHISTYGTILCRYSVIYNTSARHEQHECDTSETDVTQVRYKSDTSATRTARVQNEWKILILITTRVKTYFHTSMFTIWHVKDYKERKNFTLRTIFWKWFNPMPKYVGKVQHGNWSF